MKPLALILALLGIGALNSRMQRNRSRREEIAEENRRKEEERRNKEERQKNLPYAFDEGFTEEEFRSIVNTVPKRFKRITKVEWRTNNPLRIHFDVVSVSGITTWWFRLDFNEEGHFDENCYWYRSNTDSEMHLAVRDYICDELRPMIRRRNPTATPPSPEPKPESSSSGRGCLGAIGDLILLIIVIRILLLFFGSVF